MLRSTQTVKLVMSELAHFQESMTTIYEGAGNVRVGVTGVWDDSLSESEAVVLDFIVVLYNDTA